MTGCERAEVWRGAADCEQRRYGILWQAVMDGSKPGAAGCERVEVWRGMAGCEGRKYSPVWQIARTQFRHNGRNDAAAYILERAGKR